MSDYQDQLSVSMDAAMEEKIESYCELNDVDMQTAVHEALNEFINMHGEEIAQLIAGYRAMGNLNEEICDEFTACEAEAYSHFC
ncbi:hypothetical protein [Lacticaseibacillus thailandensis]|uniref:CopG family transcriptional regulator / antitoxin EndoAI n=2 Tax=Lacticaseibacillus thailandensis TaxID=381741 RepID=A0A0R2CE38_9LACO|nr:hypothetical protein [Lacticaseibacillus thailandensis]KRM86635.1 hypothetical protein FD19_GL001826 [Lacticaseibacillus thailandensis DSM 22698 = JCM 13996]